jgi:hypothetical protein
MTVGKMTDIYNQIIKSRKDKLLHSNILRELTMIINRYFPKYEPIAEIQGLAGGRNDLIAFKYNTRKILFEVFATASQVSRDLRILDNTVSDIKIAIIIDKEIDKKVLEKFLRENPENNYPYLFISQILDKSKIINTISILQDIISKNDKDELFKIINKKVSYKEFVKRCNEENIKILKKPINISDVTFKNVFITIVANRILKMSHDNDKVLKLIKWLNDEKLIEFILFKVDLGFNVFIYTDLCDTFCIESDGEFLDSLSIFYELENTYIILSLNKIIYEIDDKIFKGTLNINREIRFTIGHSQIYEDEDGITVTFSIPKNVKKIEMYKPMNFGNDKELEWEYYKKMINFFGE